MWIYVYICMYLHICMYIKLIRNHDKQTAQMVEHYGIRGITNRMQFSTVKECQSSKKYLKYGGPLGSVLGPFLFILFNDSLKAVAFSSVHHFDDHTNLVLANKSEKAYK